MTAEFIVPAQLEGRRLAQLLHHDLGISSSQIRSAKWDQRILVNGEPVHVSYRVRTGDHVSLIPACAMPKYQVTPLDAPLKVPFMDPYLLILDKPAGLATSSSEKRTEGSLENVLFAHLGCPPDYVFRPVNRLDKGTSGLMCVARDALSQHSLQRLLHTSDFQRTYLAVTDGLPPEDHGTISLPIAKTEGPTLRREIRPDGKPSVTHYEMLENNGKRAILRLRLETGRTHQIRVHLAALGCPVFGDFLYGKESDELSGRFALHSERIVLRHPATGETLDIMSPLPETLRHLLD